MRPSLALALMALGASAIDLPRCQSRCYDMTAEIIGCGLQDYACHCTSFESRFIPQLTSCMIEGCAFDSDEAPLNSTALKEKVCEMAGQSPPPSPSRSTAPAAPTAAAIPTGSHRPSDSPSTPTPDSPDVPDKTDSPAPTDGADGANGGSAAAGLRVSAAAVLVPLLGGYFGW